MQITIQEGGMRGAVRVPMQGKTMQHKYSNYVRTIYSGPFSPAAQRIRTLANSSSKSRGTTSLSPTANYFQRNDVISKAIPYKQYAGGSMGWLKRRTETETKPEKLKIRIPQMPHDMQKRPFNKSNTASVLSSSRSIQQIPITTAKQPVHALLSQVRPPSSGTIGNR